MLLWPVPLWPAAVGGATVRPKPTEPSVNSSPAHCLLNTPSPGVAPSAAFGNSAVARLFQVICGTIASTRRS